MSRNGSGTYTLPSGNPVVTGTTISSTWANDTLNDIATALSGSVAADGQTPITANLQMNGFKHTGLGTATGNGQSIIYDQVGTLVAAAGNVPVDTHAAASKATPVDADALPLIDSAASFGLKQLTWANLKATLNSVYLAFVTPGTSGNILTSNGSAWVSSAPASSYTQIQTIPTPTFSANAMTIPAAAFSLDFRNTALTSGTVTTITGTPAALTIPSTATLGTINAIQARLILLVLNNAGTLEYAIINEAGGNDLTETGVISTTAISAAATAANVAYSTTARTNVAYRVVGYIDITQATAGTWITAASVVQGYGGQALATMSGVGYGQTWQNLTGSRALSTTYYNTTGRPIFVAINQYNGGGTGFGLTVNGILVATGYQPGVVNGYAEFSAIVPPGASYSCTGSTINTWNELR